MKIKKDQIYIIIIITLLLAVILPFIFSLFSSYSVIIKDTDSKFYRAKILYISGNKILYIKSDKKFAKRAYAFKYHEKNTLPSIDSMLDIAYIEILVEEDPDDSDDQETNKKHLGTYTIYVQGHTGLLSFYMKNNRTYGVLRFPNWAKGVSEYLKGVRLTKNKVHFIRSITTSKELRRIGANSYFVQKYYGDFTNNGRKIKGVFYNNGAKSIWEANKME